MTTDGGGDGAELGAEVLVEPSVEERIGARRTHAQHVAHGVYDLFIHRFVKKKQFV